LPNVGKAEADPAKATVRAHFFMAMLLVSERRAKRNQTKGQGATLEKTKA
jgi:hypothetical protein